MDLEDLDSVLPLKDPGLSQLHGQIKNVMLPLLIKVFQLRLEVQQATSPPSRLQSSQQKRALSELIQQLQQLEEDLKLLQSWNQSCQMQLAKVLQEATSGSSPALGGSIRKDFIYHPAVKKSFEGALLTKTKKSSSPLSFWKEWIQKISQRKKAPL